MSAMRRSPPLRTLPPALCALALLLATSFPIPANDATPPTTILLVARAGLPDSNFRDSVVLVMNNLAPAPVGIIVNRPTRFAVSGLFPDLETIAKLDDKLYFGGPVDIATVTFLVRTDAPPENAVRVLEGVYISTNRGLLRSLLAREKPMEGLRIFIGRSGWAPGQLEAEVARGDWKLAAAEASAIFDGKAERPWPDRSTPDAGRRI